MKSLSSADKFCDSYTEIVVHHQDFSAGDESAVDEDVDRVTGEFVESHDRSAPQLQDFFQPHLGPSQLDAEVHLHFAEQVNRLPLVLGGLGRQIAEAEGLRFCLG